MWPHIKFPQGAATGNDQAIVGTAFLESLAELGIEDFQTVVDEERGKRYLLPILLHGGIPAHCAEEFSGLVLKEMVGGTDDASEMIAKWRRSPALNTAKPVQRFIKYGGVFVADLVQRMIGLVEDIVAYGVDFSETLIAEARIPTYLARSLLTQEDPREHRQRQRLPRPQLLIEPDSCAGPYLTLPPVPGGGGGNWRIRGRRRTVLNASQFDIRELPLSPSPLGWNVELDLATISRSTLFRGREDAPVYFFDKTGKLERDQHRAQGERVLVLAAEGTRIVDDENSPVPRWGEFPIRAGAWQGWNLFAVDLTGLRSARMASDVFDIKVPVWRALTRPSISTPPVENVTGPEGCRVYAAAPCVQVDDASRGDWRVRWQDASREEPARSSPLADLPRSGDTYELASLLPNNPAYSGTLEILGPLGKDYREQVAVVRELRVDTPDRVVGPDETVGVEMTALGQIGDSTNPYILSFPPNKDRAGTKVDGTRLTVTIPRLAWAIQQRNRQESIMGGERCDISLEEIESGSAEAVIARCRRPAHLRLELVGGHRVLQYEDKQVGARGSWAFPLTSFQTTAAEAGLQRILLRLKADRVAADVASIEVSHEVADLRIKSEADHEENLAYLEARWEENRSFPGRVLRLWSQHRPWEAPITQSIDNATSGFYEGLVAVPPGPYVAEIGILDEWEHLQRPTLAAERSIPVNIGGESALKSRLSALRESVPIEALELEVADQGGGVLTSDMVTEVRRELGKTLVALCEDVDDERLGRLAQLALSAEGLLVEILNDLFWSLDATVFLRLVVRMALDILECQPTVTGEQLERLWGNAPFAAALFDTGMDNASRDRWERHAGWTPRSSTRGPDPGGPITKPFDSKSPKELRSLRDTLPASGSLPLRWGGFSDAAWEMLEDSWTDERKAVNRWRSANHRFGVYTQRMGSSQRHHLERLQPPKGMPGWCKFPGDLLAAAFHLFDPYSDETVRVQTALTDAGHLAPALTARSLLVAIAMHLDNQRPTHRRSCA